MMIETPTDAEAIATTDPAAGAVDAGMQEQEQMRAALLAAKPKAGKPIAVASLKALADGINALAVAVAGPNAEKPAVLPEVKGSTIPAVPDDLYLLTAAMVQLITQADPEAAKKYELDLGSMGTDGGVRMVAAGLRATAKNAKCVKKLQAAIGGMDAAEDAMEPKESEKEASGGEMPEDAQALAAYA